MPDISSLTLDVFEQGGDATFFDTNSYNPSPNRTIILVACGIGLVSPPPVVPTVVGNGLAWSLVHSLLHDFDGVDRVRLSVFRGLSSSPTVGTTRVAYAATQFRQAITVIEFSNTDIGNLGANAIVGSPVSAKFLESAGLNPSVVPPAGENSANSHLGILGYAEPNPGITPGIGWSPLENNPTTEGMGHFLQFSQVVLPLVDFNLTSDPELGIISIELRNATPAGGPGEPQIIGRPSFIQGNLITP